MQEKIIKFVIDHVFKLRIWVLIVGGISIYFIAKYIAEDPNSTPKDIVQVVTGCSVIIVLFYSIITYEYNQRKFRYDVQNSRDVLSFNIATEWHKSVMVGYTKECSDFLDQCKPLIEKGNSIEFHEALEDKKNANQKMALLSIFNYFESISLGVKQGIMDEAFVKGFFYSIFEQFYNEYAFYIEYRRRVKKNQRIWKNFTILAQKWIDSK